MRSYNKELEKALGEDCFKRGVYKIVCNTNGNYYIGSTHMDFSRRLAHHVSLLRAGRHKNPHLQRCWEKYGEESFSFHILEVIENDILMREQVYLDQSMGDVKCTNINPLASGTPNMSPEIIAKRANTMRGKYARGEIKSSFFKGHTPWNKGKSGQYDTSFLKKPKTSTKKREESRKLISVAQREKAREVFAYTPQGDYLGQWRSSIDLQEWSLTEKNLLPIYGRFKMPTRMGRPYNFLSSQNITRSANSGKPYKGLYFTYICHIEEYNS